MTDTVPEAVAAGVVDADAARVAAVVCRTAGAAGAAE